MFSRREAILTHMAAGFLRLALSATPLLAASGLCAVGFGAPSPSAGSTATPAAEDVTQAQIEQAITRGADYLLKRQQLDGSWRPDEHKYVSGQTGLSLYTLLKAGISPRHPAIVRGLAYLRANPPRHTYGIACCLMALHAAGDEEHMAEIETWTELLLECQGQGFSYPGGHEDMSLTQYGCLGMRMAEEAGLEIPKKIWEQCIDYALNIQRDDGSFSYRQGTNATGSMTAAGVAILEIGRQALAARDDLSKRDARVLDAAIESGVGWLGDHMAVEANQPSRWHLYYLYGLERVGGLTGRKTFGTSDWYKAAANYLVRRQHASGRWGTGNDNNNEPHPGTCFGVLVLKRATAPSTGVAPRGAKNYGGDDPAQPLSIRITGDTPLTAWVSSWGDKTLKQFEWDQEIGKGVRLWRVDYHLADSGELLASVKGDPERPSGGKRFAAQFRMRRPGKHKILARAYLRPIDDDEGEEVEFVSPTIEVEVDGVMTEAMREASRDHDRDELDKTRCTCKASSKANDGHRAGLVRDGTHGHGWLSAPTDAQPWIHLEPDRPQRADHVVLSPYYRAPNERGGWGRPKRVLIEVNKAKMGEYELDPDHFGKAYLPLPKAKVVRELKVTILEIQQGWDGGHKAASGFAEIELQRRPDLIKRRKAEERERRRNR